MNNYSRIDDYVLKLVEESTPEKTMWNLEKIREGKKGTWNYIDGCMLTALMEMTRITGDPRYASFAESVADYYVQPDGSILTLDSEKANLDDINEGRVLFELFEKTGKEKYRLAAANLYQQLEAQPRTKEGNFWHKAIYPNQVWLDGIYMAQPFRALYEKHFGNGDYSDIVRQIRTVHERMLSAETGLYFHGYDASKTAFWADPQTGCSKNFWLRSLGWFAVALADLTEILPEGEEKNELSGIFADLMKAMRRYADAETG
ncbi:MAG: glycoside hydrolase family 88 protein, partial [Solobacterium sp.]|nr:glycoside hydrolase family 88 protein [Solobacterium sp.]